MRSKWSVLLVLLLAALLVVSCKGKPSDPAEEEIVIPEGLNFQELDNGLILVEGQNYAGEELEIPALTADRKQVSQIGAFGFNHLTNLKKVTIPQTILSVGASAFEGCTALTEIVLPSSVEKIGPSAFEDCTALSSVTITKYVYVIGSDAFRGCTALTEINFLGEMEQWEEIVKSGSDSNWIETDKVVTIHCTDGDIVTGS